MPGSIEKHMTIASPDPSNVHIVDISSLGGLGDGIATLNGKPVFVEKAAAGDRLRVRIVHDTKEHSRGEIVAILQGGPDRIAPPCPYFSACGGCSLQQISEISYRDGKRRVLAQALAHGGFPDVNAELVFLPPASRRRAEFKLHSASFAYYAPRSHQLVPVENCLILEPELQALMTPLSKQLASWKAAGAIKTASVTLADSGIDLALECSSDVQDTTYLNPLAEQLNIARISLNGKTVVNRAPVTMALGGYEVALPAGAFLQASKEGQKLLTDAVLDGVKGAKSIADLFCGIGTYGFPLSKSARVHGVEMDAAMIRGLKAMTQLHGISDRFTTEARDLFKNPLTDKQLTRFDAVILNPPRPGAKAQCEALATSQIKNVVMVSCNPASFARDAKILGKAGFTLAHAQGIDQFVYSPHLEIVAVFKK